MRYKIIVLVFSLLFAASCNVRSTDKVETSDSIALESKPMATLKPATAANTWHARVTPVNGSKNYQLVVTGNIPIRDSPPRPTLSRKKTGSAINLSELVLTLSAEPVISGKLTEVRYEEKLTRPEKYQKVTILHGKKTIATIASIESGPAR